jgi:hypothetical protein
MSWYGPIVGVTCGPPVAASSNTAMIPVTPGQEGDQHLVQQLGDRCPAVSAAPG